MLIPERMMRLDRDRRGYPIPWIVFRDDDNQPHFTINDTRKVLRCASEDRCSICGEKLLRGRWFIGGPKSALHPQGAYIDPPLHHECMQFAARTCPYLVRASYAGRLDAATLDPAKAKGVIGFQDTTMDPTRPACFVAVMAVGQSRTPNGYLVPKRPYRRLEIWKDGALIEVFDAEQIMQKLPDVRVAQLTEESPVVQLLSQ